MRQDDIHIDVKIQFVEQHSQAADNRYVYAYTITICNRGTRAAQLISRQWKIKDSRNKIQEVRGLGVVGEQPRLQPGERFTYTSSVVLETLTGTMEGKYQMQCDNGDTFDANIPMFALASPLAIH